MPNTVFFDATPLALWEEAAAHRAGTGRMAVHTLKALLGQAGLQVYLVCPGGGEAGVRQFLESRPWAERAQLLSRGEAKNVFFERGKRLARAFVRSLLACLPPPLEERLWRWSGRRPFAAWERPDGALQTLVETHLARDGFNLWFSCFQPVPESVAGIDGVVKYVVLHDLIPLRLRNKHAFYEPCLDLMRQHIRKADVIWANSEFTRADFLDYFPAAAPQRVRVALHGGSETFASGEAAPSTLAHALARCGMQDGTPYFLTLCTLEPRKGLACVMEAFCRLAASRRDVHLILVGRLGWGYASLVRAAMSHGRIHLAGFLPDGDISSLLRGALGLVYMSEYEGFGLPVVEGMACGTPVIAAHATSLPEVGGDAVLYAPPNDARSLERQMERLCDDENLRRALGRKGRERAGNFTWTRFAAAIVRNAEQSACLPYEDRKRK